MSEIVNNMKAKSLETQALINPHSTYLSVSKLRWKLIYWIEKKAISRLDKRCWWKFADILNNNTSLRLIDGSLLFYLDRDSSEWSLIDIYHLFDDINEVSWDEIPKCFKFKFCNKKQLHIWANHLKGRWNFYDIELGFAKIYSSRLCHTISQSGLFIWDRLTFTIKHKSDKSKARKVIVKWAFNTIALWTFKTLCWILYRFCFLGGMLPFCESILSCLCNNCFFKKVLKT
jgi:hypothetical protein